MWFWLQKKKKKKKKNHVGLYLDIYWLISFKLGVIIQIAELFILVPVLVTLTFIQGHGCIRGENFTQFLIDFDEIQYAAKICWCVESQAKFICIVINIQRRELVFCDFIKCSLNTGLCSDAYL